jgi:transposase
MANPISNEKRADIIKHMEAGAEKKKVAEWLFIHERTVSRVWKKYQATGNYEPEAKKSGRKPLLTEEQMNEVFEKIKEQPDITLQELIDEFILPLSQSALSRRIRKAGLTFKKRHSMQMGKNEKM